MINSIIGKCTEYKQIKKDLSVCVFLECGIEFNIFISDSTCRQLRIEASKYSEPSIKHDVRFFIHLLHKEDRMQLFGFYTEKEREMFLRLIKVKGVGEKTALRILAIDVDDLMKSIERRDQGRLTEIEGLGLKTASEIIKTLGEKEKK